MKHTAEEIKNRLSNIGEAIGKIALDYITELEKENAELKDKLEKETAHRIRNFNKAIEWKEKHRTLIKENAELKKENQKWKDGITLKDEEIGCIETDFNTFKSKAKELLKQWLQTSKASGCDNINIVADTEQFLKGVEK